MQAALQFGEHVLGEREMAGGQPGGASGIPHDDCLGERGMLAQRPVAHVGRVRLGVEAPAAFPAGPPGPGRSAAVGAIACPTRPRYSKASVGSAQARTSVRLIISSEPVPPPVWM